MTLPDYIRPAVTVKRWDGSETFFSYSAFSPPGSDPRVLEVEVEDREMQPGLFAIRIEDNARSLDPRVGNGNKVVIQLGHAQEALSNYMAGYVRQVETLRNPKNSANTAVSGTPRTVEIDIGGTPYYFPVYPASSA